MRAVFILPLVVSACTVGPVTPPDALPFFGNGYRFDGDACRKLGESSATQDYLDDAADLVGCPDDLENLGVFVIDTGAREVVRRDGYVIFSVPRR